MLDKSSEYFFSRYKICSISTIALVSLFVINHVSGFPDYALVLFAGAYITLGLGIWRVWQDSTRGIHSKAWICFVVFIATYSIGEIFWTMCAKEIANSCATAEMLWLVGYLPLIMFATLYIKPFVSSISKKSILVSSLASLAILIPALYYITQYDSIADDPELLSIYLYTVFDAILIIPMWLGFSLFYKGRIGFTWLFVLFAILSMTIADFMFISTKLNGSMFIDEWQNIFYVGEYTFFSLGLYYKSRNFHTKNTFYNQESLR